MDGIIPMSMAPAWSRSAILDGTVTEEKIAHDAGAPTAQSMTVHELVRLIREAGRKPVERDTVFNTVKEW